MLCQSPGTNKTNFQDTHHMLIMCLLCMLRFVLAAGAGATTSSLWHGVVWECYLCRTESWQSCRTRVAGHSLAPGGPPKPGIKPRKRACCASFVAHSDSMRLRIVIRNGQGCRVLLMQPNIRSNLGTSVLRLLASWAAGQLLRISHDWSPRSHPTVLRNSKQPSKTTGCKDMTKALQQACLPIHKSKALGSSVNSSSLRRFASKSACVYSFRNTGASFFAMAQFGLAACLVSVLSLSPMWLTITPVVFFDIASPPPTSFLLAWGILCS